MSVYRPRRKTSENGKAQSRYYIYEFELFGKRFRGSCKTTNKEIAKEVERKRKTEIERAAAGIPSPERATGIRTVNETIDAYLEGYRTTHRKNSILFAEGRLAKVKESLGGVLLSDLKENRIRTYQKHRKAVGASGRSVNAELGELSRAIGQPWSVLWPSVKKFEERKDIGRAISPEEQSALLAGLDTSRSTFIPIVVPALILTGARVSELLSLTWGQLDLMEKTVQIGRAKTSSGTGRVIPYGDELASILAAHRAWFVDKFGDPRRTHFVFPFNLSDPTQPTADISRGWDELRKATGVKCRLHDLRHCFATKLAEAGVPESTMMALMGHMSRRMLEHYSHIRLTAKRAAIASITLHGTPTVPSKIPRMTENEPGTKAKKQKPN